MWKILGKESLYVEMADVFKNQVLELSKEIENGEKIIEIISNSEVTYLFNGTTETHAFTIRPEEKTSPEEIQLIADAILAIANSDPNRYFVSLNDEYQKCIVNVRTDVEPELIGMNRTEGFASGRIFQPIFESLSKPGRSNDSMMN